MSVEKKKKENQKKRIKFIPPNIEGEFTSQFLSKRNLAAISFFAKTAQ